MSVLRSNRQVAFTEFERQMGIICREVKNRLSSVPARYRKFINPKLYEPASKAYRCVTLANEQSPKTAQGLARRNALLDTALKSIMQLQKPLLAYWNLKDSTEGGMKELADMLNREIALIFGVQKREGVRPMIIILPTKKMERLAFLKKMSELHKFTYQKIGHAPTDCKDFVSDEIALCADTALCSVVLANNKIPETREEADHRATHLQNAIDNLNAMQRPLLSLWNIMDYSENIMDEWAGLLNEELKILEGLKKADQTKYKNLR